MTQFIIDASTAVKWFLPESHAEAARRVLDTRHDLMAPDLIWAEVGNAIRKRWRRGEVSQRAARALLQDFRRFPLRIHASDTLLQGALDLAMQDQRSLYDNLYLALAVYEACPLVWNTARTRRTVSAPSTSSPAGSQIHSASLRSTSSP